MSYWEIVKRMMTQHRRHIVLAGAVVGLFAVAGALYTTTVQAVSNESRSGKHIISVYDNGEEKGFVTDKNTLREAFKEAGIILTANDMTEPSLDETLVAASYAVNVYRARPVVIVDGTTRTKVMTPYRTAEQITSQAKVPLHTEDVASFEYTHDVMRDGAFEVLHIARATPFTFVVYGKTTQAYTRATTVAAMLQEKRVTVGPQDGLSVDVSATIMSGMTVQLWRNGTQTMTQEETIAKPTEQIRDANHEVGYKEIKTPGKDGKKNVTYEIEMRDGKEVSRKQIASVTLEEPTKEVVIVGTKMKNAFSGDFAGALARLRSCEGSYTSNTGNGYYGAYQFDIRTWGGFMGYPHAAAAPPEVQDQKAWETYQRRGWQPWPSCTVKMGLQDIYR